MASLVNSKYFKDQNESFSNFPQKLKRKDNLWTYFKQASITQILKPNQDTIGKL